MFSAVAVIVAIIAVGAGLLGLRLLLRRRWVLGWLRGTVGLVLMAAAVVLAFSAWDLQHYRSLSEEQAVAALAFSQLAPRHFQVELKRPGAPAESFELRGDLWQLDVRLLKWHDRLLRWGWAPVYRLDRISGRYLSLEQERTAPRTVVGLQGQEPGIDVWHWLQSLAPYIPLVDARYGSAAYLPMRDGARFTVTVGATGLVARPANGPAQMAVESWQ